MHELQEILSHTVPGAPQPQADQWLLAASGLAAVKDNGTADLTNAAMRAWLRIQAACRVRRGECYRRG